jgi:hypothetical protein
LEPEDIVALICACERRVSSAPSWTSYIQWRWRNAGVTRCKRIGEQFGLVLRLGEIFGRIKSGEADGHRWGYP